MVFWHRHGLREEDARAMQTALAPIGVRCVISEHYNDLAPDAFFVRQNADVELVREVLAMMPSPPQYIFPSDYPSDECGVRSRFDMSVGLHAIHRYDQADLAETPYVFDRADLAYLTEPAISQEEFSYRLLEVAPSRLDPSV